MTVPTIFETCRPRADVLEGAITEADFAADLAQVIIGTGNPAYLDPARFFADTYPTRGLKKALLHGLGRGWNSPFPQAVAQAMRSNTGRPSAVIVFRTFWPSWISVICLEKLRDLSLGPITLFQRPICVSIRLRWLYPVATCQAMRPLLRIWAIWRSRTVGSRADCGWITAFFGGGITTSRVSPYRCLSISRVDAPS